MGWWSDFKGWVSDNSKNIIMGVAAAATIAVGIAVAVCAAPVVAAIVGGALIGGGVSALMASFSKKTTWKDWGLALGKGAIIGAVSGAFSFGASALIANCGLSGVSNLILSCTVRIGTAMASSFVTNGLNNLFNGKDFTENWKAALFTGFIIGGIGAAAEGFRYFSAKAAAGEAHSLLNKVSGKISELKDQYNQAITGALGKFSWVAHGAVEMGKVLVEGAAMQYVLTGTIDWKLVCIGVVIYGGTRIARTAYENRQRQQNDKLINEAFDDHEKRQDQNVKDAKEMAEEKATGKLKQADRALRKDPGNIEKQEAVQTAQRELQDIKDGKMLPHRPGRDEKIQTCTGRMRDPKGNVTTGRNSGQRDHDGKRHNTEPEYDKMHLENEHRDDLPKRYTVRQGEEYTHNGETRVAERGGPRAMTDAESKTQWPNDYKNRDRGCAEVEAITRADDHNQAKTDLGKSTIVTVGSEHKLDKNGMVVESTHQLKPSCNKGCNEIKFERNLTQQDHLAEQIQRRDVKGEQTFIDVRKSKKKEKGEDNEEASTSRVSSDGKPFLDNQDYPLEDDNGSSDEEDFSQGIVCKKTGIRKLLKTSDDTLESLEEELRWQTALKRKCEKEKEEKEKLKNDDFIRNNIIRKENIYATSRERQAERAGTSRQVDDAYPAGQFFSKKKKVEQEEEETNNKNWDWKVWKKGKETESSPRTKQRLVETFPIVAWSEKHNKYMMVDHNSWPKSITGKTKMIAFLGVHKSGRTTLLHSLIYQAGYTMTKEQSLITKLGLGINMYILRELGLIFLDICDSMDMIGDLQKDCTPMGNVLLEAFGYVNCDHLVYSLPYGEETEMTKKEAIDYIKTRVELLFTVSNRMLNFAGAMRITLVPRQQFVEGNSCGKWRQLEQHFEEMQSRIEVAKLNDTGEDGAPLSDQERFGHLKEEDVLLGMKHHTTVLPVRFFQPGRSMTGDEYYRRELKRLGKSVKEETGAHPSTMEIEEMSETSVYGCMITTWNRLVKNKDITNCVTEVNNEKMMERARGDDGRQHAIEIYYKNLEDYLKQVPSDSSISREFERYLKERERCSKEYEKTPEDERDPETFLRLLLKSGTILIKECLQMTDIQLKEKGLQIGLSVFSTLLGQGDKMMDIRLLRLGIVDLDLISLINDPLVYMHYHQAWVIFYFMATRGFRFHLLEVSIWDALQEILTRKDELTQEKMKIYDWSLHTLMAMMDLDEMPMLAAEKNDGRLNDDKLYLSSKQRIQLDYDYRLYSKEHVQRLFKNTIDNPRHASDNYDKMIELAKDFYNGHEICKETRLLFDDLHVGCKNQFAHVTLNHFHKECAGHFVQKLFEEKVMDVLKMRGKEGKSEAVVLTLKLLRTATGVIIKDEKLVHLLATSGLPDWLLSTFLKNDNCSFPIYCHAASIASQIIFAQYSLEFGELPKVETGRRVVHTLEEVRARERRENQVKQYGAYRLQLLEAGCHRVAVKILQGFFDKGMSDLPEATKLLNFLTHLIVCAVDDEDRKNFVDLFLVQKRETLISQMEQLTNHCAERVNLEQKDDGHLAIIDSAMTLVNRLIWSYYNNSFKNFFGSQNSRLWKATASILQAVEKKVIQPRLTAKDHLEESIEKRIQSLELEFICLALNVSTISGITFTEVKAKLGHERVATLGDLNEENPRVKGHTRPEILLNMDHLAKLDLENTGYDKSNVQRAAYVINSADRNAYNEFKGLVANLVKKAKMLKREKEEDQKRLEVATTRRKTLEALEKRQLASSGPSYADRMRDQPSTSSARPVKMACDGVYLKTSLLDDFSLPRKNWEDLLFGKLIEVYDLEASYGYMLLLSNNSNDGREKLAKFLQHMHQLLDISGDQVLDIDSSETFLSLNWMPTILAYLGYCHVRGTSGDTWLAPTDILSRERAIICNILEEFLPRQREIALKLDTSFREVGEMTEATYGEQTLPEEFFSSADTPTLQKLKKRTILELIQEKKDYAQWMKKETFTYVLVRVETTSRGKRRVYQAVFNRFMSVTSILDSLQSGGVVVSTLHLSPEALPLDSTQKLEDIGIIAVYLYGR